MAAPSRATLGSMRAPAPAILSATVLSAAVLCACDAPASPPDDAEPPFFDATSPDLDAAMRDAAPRDAGGGDAGTPSAAGCAPLGPVPSGAIVVTADRADELASIVSSAPAGATIALEDGTYTSTRSGEANRRLIFRQPGVTLRSVSGDPTRVILDAEYLTNELLYVVADDVTIAGITLRRAVDHLAHVTSEGADSVTGVRFTRVRFVDAGEQQLKINPGTGDGWIDDGVVECSSFTLTDEGRPHVERAGGGCYTGGIDAHAARGWVVRQSTFTGIYCAGEGLAEHAVHFWRSSRDTLVENNLVVDCARGVGFGLDDTMERRAYPDDPYPGVRPIAHFDGVIRNNVIFARTPYYDTGIELHYARGARVHHNTVVSTDEATGFFSSIDYRFATTQVALANNLARRITARDGGNATLEANLEPAPLALFVDPDALDFHLAATASAAIDQGVVLDDAGLDLDGEPRTDGAPDLGADER